MLLVYLIILESTAFVFCNPFHKYPFVFLLDVGNEELEKTNTEQIRITVPGGSIALRYPAEGNGDTVSRVRVSGIDFGTDLKANIVEGGPGYNYVVLVFSGNAGVPYDAVLTVDTCPDEMDDGQVQDDTVGSTAKNGPSNDTPSDTGSSEIDNNVDYNDNDFIEVQSAESSINKKNAEIIQKQSTSNDYGYAGNEVSDGEDYSDEDTDDGKDIHKLYRQIYQKHNQGYNTKEVGNQVNKKDSISTQNQNENVSSGPKAEPYSFNNGFIDDEFTGEGQIGVVDKNLYEKYKALKPHLYNDVRVYPQEAVHDAEIENSRSDFNTGEDPVEIDQMFNDEEIHNDADKFKDANNNYFDSDDSSAVAY